MWRRPRLSAIHLRRRKLELTALVVATAVLQVGAGVGMAYVAGFHRVVRLLAGVEWYWLVVLVGSLVLSLVGYHFAIRGVYEADGGPGLGPSLRRSASIAGFGGFLAHGGSGIDRYALRAAGSDEEDAALRVGALAGLEHGVLGLVGTAGAMAVLLAGRRSPPLGFSLPWAVIPVPGFLLGFWLAAHYCHRLEGATGWREHLRHFLKAINLVRCLFERMLHRPPAVVGMAVFWGAEMFAIWCGMAAFGFQMDAAQLILGVGTGMLFTRRTGPLAGAGILMLTLPASVYYSGAPLAVAVTGVFAYRALSIWLPMPLSLAQLPRLRSMGEASGAGVPGHASGTGEPALPQDADMG